MSYRKEDSLILENYSEKHRQGDIVSIKILQTVGTLNNILTLYTELRLIVCLVFYYALTKSVMLEKKHFRTRCILKF